MSPSPNRLSGRSTAGSNSNDVLSQNKISPRLQQTSPRLQQKTSPAPRGSSKSAEKSSRVLTPRRGDSANGKVLCESSPHERSTPSGPRRTPSRTNCRSPRIDNRLGTAGRSPRIDNQQELKNRPAFGHAPFEDNHCSGRGFGAGGQHPRQRQRISSAPRAGGPANRGSLFHRSGSAGAGVTTTRLQQNPPPPQGVRTGCEAKRTPRRATDSTKPPKMPTPTPKKVQKSTEPESTPEALKNSLDESYPSPPAKLFPRGAAPLHRKPEKLPERPGAPKTGPGTERVSVVIRRAAACSHEDNILPEEPRSPGEEFIVNSPSPGVIMSSSSHAKIVDPVEHDTSGVTVQGCSPIPHRGSLCRLEADSGLADHLDQLRGGGEQLPRALSLADECVRDLSGHTTHGIIDCGFCRNDKPRTGCSWSLDMTRELLSMS